MKIKKFDHQFVKSAPRELEEGILYVSLEYCTMLHSCACGCGRKVVTPLSPNDWSMTFDGRNISVDPSIGSWSLPCRSHYFIKRGIVQWAGDWNDEQIKKGRAANLVRKRGYDNFNKDTPSNEQLEIKGHKKSGKPSFVSKFFGWIRDKF